MDFTEFVRPWTSQYSIIKPQRSELKWCVDRGTERWLGSKELGLRERGYSTRDSKRMLNIKGVIGEWLFCWAYGLENFKELIRVKKDPDEGRDVYAFGKWHGIRLTSIRGGGYIIRSWDKINFDYASLVEWDGYTARMCGYIDSQLIKDKKKPWKDQAQIPRTELLPWEWLPFHCKQGDEWLKWWINQVPEKGQFLIPKWARVFSGRVVKD